MKQMWTLHVENFGKIKEASIEVRPFMIFAGENNSGKSYLMSLLWGLLNSGDELFTGVDVQTDCARQCLVWLKKNIAVETDSFVVDESGQQLLLKRLNEVLSLKKDWLAQKVLNRPTSIGSMSIVANESIDFLVHPNLNEGNVWGFSGSTATIPQASFLLKQSDEKLMRTIDILSYYLLLSYLGFVIGPAYLPASRTGFMLTYKTLVKAALNHTFGTPSASRTTLNWPTNIFLQSLASLGFDWETSFGSIAEYIQTHVLHGTITREDTPVPTYKFLPSGVEEEFPLYATSSLVTEVAPLVLFLQSNSLLTGLIIEEPEAHLHLEMQKKIAIALARLVNLGLPVWITTHSDTMAQQFNNLIQLHQHPNRSELSRQFGYDETSDFLDPNAVAAYQFSVKPDGTEVEKLPLTSGGIAFPTFTNSIIAQAKQTIAFEDVTEDDDQD